MAKVVVTWSYNDDTEDGKKIEKWLLSKPVQKNVAAAIRKKILGKDYTEDGMTELRDEVAQLREELEELRKKVEGK
jgi:hypothetical protein